MSKTNETANVASASQNNSTQIDTTLEEQLTTIKPEFMKEVIQAIFDAKELPYHTRLNPPAKKKLVISKPSKVQESLLDCRSPQETLEKHGMYRDPSIYQQEPTKIYADMTQFTDYADMIVQTREAERKFNNLDPDVKAKFNNSVVEFASYLSSDKFDINEILTDKEKQALMAHNKKVKAQQEYDDYINSDEFKKAQAESQAYFEFQKQQFNEWKKTRS